MLRDPHTPKARSNAVEKEVSHGSSLKQISLNIMFKITECFDPGKHLDHNENSFSFFEGGGSRGFVFQDRSHVMNMYSSIIKSVLINMGAHTYDY